MDCKTCWLKWVTTSTAIFAALTSMSLHARPLDLVEVDAVSFNCIFSLEPGAVLGCRLPIGTDLVSRFSLPGFSGEAGLQSRTLQPGTAETGDAEGLRAYVYKFRLLDLAGEVGGPCVSSLTLPYFEQTRLDFNGDGEPDDAWVTTRGSPGGILNFGTRPRRVERIGRSVSFIFDPPICADDESQFSGLASSEPPTTVTAQVGLTSGEVLDLDVVLPTLSDGWLPPPPPCEIRGTTPAFPFPAFVPVCRCLQDDVVRELRCGLLLPDLRLERTIPWPIPFGESFSVKWSLTPLRQIENAVSITEVLPAGVEAQKQSSRITFPQGIAVDETVELELALTAAEAIGKVPSSATVDLPGGNIEINGLGFNVQAGNKPQQDGRMSQVAWLAIIAGALLLVVLLLRARRS